MAVIQYIKAFNNLDFLGKCHHLVVVEQLTQKKDSRPHPQDHCWYFPEKIKLMENILLYKGYGHCLVVERIQ